MPPNAPHCHQYEVRIIVYTVTMSHGNDDIVLLHRSVIQETNCITAVALIRLHPYNLQLTTVYSLEHHQHSVTSVWQRSTNDYAWVSLTSICRDFPTSLIADSCCHTLKLNRTDFQENGLIGERTYRRIAGSIVDVKFELRQLCSQLTFWTNSENQQITHDPEFANSRRHDQHIIPYTA